MREFEATLTQKGQITIPSRIRSHLGLKPHDKIVFEIEGDTVRFKRAESKILKWYGSVTPTERPEDFQRVRDHFEKGVTEEMTNEG